MEEILKKFSIRVRDERENMRLSQTELANKMELAPQTVNGWEGARRIPDAATLIQLANLFGCTIDYLLGRTDNRECSVITDEVAGDRVKIEIDNEYLEGLTIKEIKDLLLKIRDVGYNIDSLK